MVYLKSDLTALTDRYRAFAWLALVILAGSLVLAYLISGKLEKQISAPILALAGTARAIADHRDNGPVRERRPVTSSASWAPSRNGS